MPNTCNITGFLRDLEGNLLVNTTVGFQRVGVKGQDGVTVVPYDFSVESSGSGFVDFEAYPGTYTGYLIASGRTERFTVMVPEEEAIDLSSAIEAVFVDVTPSDVLLAQNAAATAQAAAVTAVSFSMTPESYEANAGDGSTDAVSAFLTADANGAQLNLTPGKVYRLASSITMSQPIIWRGGVIKPDSGVTLTADIIAPPGVRVFDISNLSATAGQSYNANATSFSVNGGLKTGTSAHAAWFGATEASDDNSKELQCLMDCGAAFKGIDGDYDFTAIYYGEGHVYSSKAIGGMAKLSCKVQSKTMNRLAGDPALNYWGNAGFFGIINGPGASPTVGLSNPSWENIEIDMRGEDHFDFGDDFDEVRDGSNLIKFRISAHGFSATEDADAEANGWIRAPQNIKLTKVVSHDSPRNCFLLNGGVAVNMSQCRGYNSLIDHCIYGDVNPDSAIVDCEVGGYAESGMLVSSGMTVTRLRCNDIAENPLTDIHTGCVINDRGDVVTSTLINDPRIKADFANLNVSMASDRKVFCTFAKHMLQVVGGSVEHTGSDVPFAIFGTGDNDAIAYQGPDMRGVQFTGMSSQALFIGASGIQVNNMRWNGGLWRYLSGATSEAGSLILVGSMTGGKMSEVIFDGPSQGIGYRSIISCDDGDLTRFRVVDQDWAQGNGADQWATVSGDFVGCEVRGSWLRCGRPSDRNVRWRGSFYGTNQNPTEQTFFSEGFVGDGTATSFALSHVIGDPPYFVSAIAVSGFARAVDPIGIAKGTNTLDVIFDSPVANGETAFVDLTLRLTE